MMIDNKSTFWSVFTMVAVAIFVPLLVILAVFYSTGGFTLLLTIIGVYVVIGLGAAYFVASQVDRPISNAAATARKLVVQMDSPTADHSNNLSKISDLAGPSELRELTAVLGGLVADVQDRAERLDVIYEIGQTVTQQLEYQDALEGVLSAVARVVNYDAAEVIISDDQKLTVDAWHGKDGLIDTTGRVYDSTRGLAGSIATTKEPLLMPVVTEESTDSRRTLAAGEAIREILYRTNKLLINSFLGIPLLVKDDLIGVITLVHHEKHHFTAADQERLETLASQASIAIKNALQIREREADLKSQIRNLQIQIDEVQRNREVEAVVGSDYFKSLREQAHTMRIAAKQRRQSK